MQFGEIEDYGKYPKKPWLRNHPLYIDFDSSNLLPTSTKNQPELFGFHLGVHECSGG
jgi:hypothetical protein